MMTCGPVCPSSLPSRAGSPAWGCTARSPGGRGALGEGGAEKPCLLAAASPAFASLSVRPDGSGNRSLVLKRHQDTMGLHPARPAFPLGPGNGRVGRARAWAWARHRCWRGALTAPERLSRAPDRSILKQLWAQGWRAAVPAPPEARRAAAALGPGSGWRRVCAAYTIWRNSGTGAPSPREGFRFAASPGRPLGLSSHGGSALPATLLASFYTRGHQRMETLSNLPGVTQLSRNGARIRTHTCLFSNLCPFIQPGASPLLLREIQSPSPLVFLPGPREALPESAQRQRRHPPEVRGPSAQGGGCPSSLGAPGPLGATGEGAQWLRRSKPFLFPGGPCHSR